MLADSVIVSANTFTSVRAGATTVVQKNGAKQWSYSYTYVVCLWFCHYSSHVGVKIATLTLTTEQVELTLVMQNLQPKIKAIQEKYKGNQDGHPPLGWSDTIAYLVSPVLLCDDPSAKNSLLVLKFLPFMIGYFSLSVPSGLSIYCDV
ncbi:inner membrane protein ALBINO3, chloroplastic-like [Typha latifolia]|uniref:inner membrane protein ALBINO3, chloroplastic-like n=1 Tax=Typha latifolia TaxID=4733 RepID=UPI003C2EC9BD